MVKKKEFSEDKEPKKRKQKHKLIEHKVNLKKEDYSDCIITVTGIQGAGKTSWVVDFVREIYRRQNKHRARESNVFIDELNSLKVDGKKCYNLAKSPQNHYIYTGAPFSFILDKKFRVITQSIDPKLIGLPDNKGSFDYIPYGSIIIVDEADEVWPNREWQSTPPETIQLLKYIRHNHITLILLCQVLGNLDKKFRELTMQHYHIYYRQIKKRWLFFKPKLIWHYYVTYPQEILMVQNLAEVGLDKIKPRVEYFKYVSKENPHKYYVSRSGLPLFLRNINNYKYDVIPVCPELDRKTVAEVCAWKEKDKAREQFEEEVKFWKFIKQRADLKVMKEKYKNEMTEYIKENIDVNNIKQK